MVEHGREWSSVSWIVTSPLLGDPRHNLLCPDPQNAHGKHREHSEGYPVLNIFAGVTDVVVSIRKVSGKPPEIVWEASGGVVSTPRKTSGQPPASFWVPPEIVWEAPGGFWEIMLETLAGKPPAGFWQARSLPLSIYSSGIFHTKYFHIQR